MLFRDIFVQRENSRVFFFRKQRKFLFIITERCGDIFPTALCYVTLCPNGNAIFPTRRPSWIGVFLSKKEDHNTRAYIHLSTKNYDFAWAGAMSGLGYIF